MTQTNVLEITNQDSNHPDVVGSCNILEMNHDEARAFFLKEESYCNFYLPQYFKFKPIIDDLSKAMTGKRLSDFKDGNPNNYDDVNYKVLHSKDGRYAWRSMQLIHPVLYVSLVHDLTTEGNWRLICNRFKKFADNTKIECMSLPRESLPKNHESLSKNSDKAKKIRSWWRKVEQKSIELSLDYDYLTQTDITDCYGSIYTHSIAWALHDKDFIKEGNNRNNKNIIGNIIDRHLRNMSHNQTNGIPQGSVLMDFIAEIVLGYADLLLAKKIEKAGIEEYKIIRYRDDYRIFTNNPHESEKILKSITEVMIGLGLKLNAQKTKLTTEVIRGSIKDDKLHWMKQKQGGANNLQKHLLLIHGLANDYPGSGSLIKALGVYAARLRWLKKLYEDVILLIGIITGVAIKNLMSYPYAPTIISLLLECLRQLKKLYEDVIPLISITTDIAIKNPRLYPHTATIVSLLLPSLKDDSERCNMINKIIRKFNNIPNTGHLLIWLQYVTLGFKFELQYDFHEPLCKLVAKEEGVQIWNNLWLKKEMQDEISISTKKIVDYKYTEKFSGPIPEEETSFFKTGYNSND